MTDLDVNLDRRQLLTGAATAAVAAALSPFAAAPTRAAAPFAGKQAPSFYRAKVGDFEVTVLSDGQRIAPIPDGYVRNVSKEQVAAAAEAAYMPKGQLVAPFNPLVVNTGSKLVLLDTGFGPGVGPTVGLLQNTMQVAGIDPKTIDIVICSHMHGDHILGLKNADGSLAFPNAEIKVPAADWAFWMNDDNAAKYQDGFNKAQMGFNRKIFGNLRDKVTRYDPGNEVAPGITAVDASGHTPGQCALVIASGSSRILFQGDVTNVPDLFLRNPDWHVMFDHEPEKAVATRRRIHDMAAAEKLLIHGFHYPFPALGYSEKSGNGYRVVPVAWSPVI
jgi:glyoxylase-like metal-dependent hydrolase (beta-lactamase superfamily II)